MKGFLLYFCFAYSKAIEINPKYANAFYNRACAHALFSENKEQITADLSRAIDLESTFKENARNDADFAKWKDKAWFRELVGEEKKEGTK